MNERDPIYRAAKRRIKERVKFYKHLQIFIVVNALFIAMSVFHSGQLEWLPMTFFWGIGLFAHYQKVMRQEKEPMRPAKKISGFLPTDVTSDEYLELKQVKKVKRNWSENDLV